MKAMLNRPHNVSIGSIVYILLLFVLPVVLIIRHKLPSKVEQARPQTKIAAQVPLPPPPPPTKYKSTEVEDCQSYIPDQFSEMDFDEASITYSSENKLSYSGYEILKKVRGPKENLGGHVDIEYAVLQHQGRVVFKFDSPSLAQPSEARFGLFSFLGGASKQLVVEQTSNKFWHYWIVNLSPKFELIYDSGKYDLVFDLRPTDLDGDGRFEIVQYLGAYWYVLGDNVYSPRPPIILKYNTSAHEYLPANQEFQSFVLKDIEQRISKGKRIKQSTDGLTCQTVLYDVMLRYLYAGRKREAWKFFEQEYHQPDKKEERAALKRLFNKDSVYRAIYHKGRA